MDERVLLLALFLAPVLAGAVLGSMGGLGRMGRPWRSALERLAAIRTALVAQAGGLVAAAVILLAGASMIVLVCWPLGELAQALEAPIDVPAFEWMQARSVPDDAWGRVSTTVTMMGDPQPMRAIVAIAAVAFAVAWRRRRWWIPPLILVTTLELEWYLQKLLAAVVERGHPPVETGTYPSGGSARAVAVFGVIFFLILLTRPGISRRWRVVGWSIVALLAAVEGYTRFYLLKHWITDIPGGWIFGAMVLLVMMAAASALVAPTTDPTQRMTATTERADPAPV